MSLMSETKKTLNFQSCREAKVFLETYFAISGLPEYTGGHGHRQGNWESGPRTRQEVERLRH